MSETATHIAQLQIAINCVPLPNNVMDLLDDAVVEDDLAQAAMFALRFNDPRLELLDGPLFALGAEVRVSAARENQPPRQFMVGEITALEPSLEQHNLVLVVRGYDRSHRLRRGARTRTFVNQSDSEIAEQIAREVGLGIEAAPSNVRHRFVVQDGLSDWAFLQERAARLGYRMRVEERTLHFGPPERTPPRAPKLAWGQQLLSFHARLSAAAQPGVVQVRGWDAATKQPILGSAARPTQPVAVNGKQSAGDVADGAFGMPATVVVGEQPVASQTEAERLAQAILDDLDGQYFAAEGMSLGEPALRAGCVVELTGVGKRLAGAYAVTATRHEYTPQGGYTTTFFVTGKRPNGLLAAVAPESPRRAIGGVAVGLVTNIADPEHGGRVKLRFPWQDEGHESDWTRLAIPGAGGDRGVFAAPQVDDEVLVAFEHGDPARPFVLGGLWNGKDRPPAAATKQNRDLTFIRTAQGRLLALDDAEGALTLHSGNHTITLNENGVAITSGSDMTLTAQGTLTIKGTLVKIN